MSKSVYHYCSVETFHKIITNRELWLTDITKSNDNKELQLAYDTLKKMLDARLKKCKDSNNIISTFQNAVSKSEKNSECMENLIKINALESCVEIFEGCKFFDKLFHICCFSGESDSLSQWAMYADDGKGVAIGFNSDMFMNYERATELDFRKVDYSLDQFIDKVDKEIDYVLSVYGKNNETNDKCLKNFAYFIIDEVINKAYYYKNKSFEQENEFRLVYNSKPFENKVENGLEIREQYLKNEEDILSPFKPIEENKGRDAIHKINYYVKNGKLVSYRPLHFITFNFWINEVVIGPKSLLTEDDVCSFLQVNELYLSRDNIRRSEISYQ